MRFFIAQEKRKKPKFPPLIYLVFLIAVAASLLAFDFIQWKMNKRSRIFERLLGRSLQMEIAVQYSPADKVYQYLTTIEIPASSISQYKDSQGIEHIMISISEELFPSVSSLLEAEFNEAEFSLQKKKERENRANIYYLWEVTNKQDQRLIILFDCRKSDVLKERELTPEDLSRSVAIIIDDMGFNLETLKEICSIQFPLTIAVLPYSPHAEETAYVANQNGLEVILHLPLESLNDLEANQSAAGIIRMEMTEEEIRNKLQENLDQVPLIVGVNNHMGSKITRNEGIMRIILEEIKEKDLFFIDSVTTGGSKAYEVAREIQVPTAFRSVFLDSDVDEDSIRHQLTALFQMAQKSSTPVVGICHPLEPTLKVLRENLHTIDEYGLILVYASQIVK
jgi:polysaccharide deacetylase 2 family uncharacterized protein YibQ